VKPVVPRRRAERDIENAFNGYLSAAGPDAAMAFVDALERAMSHISRQPGSGSPRYGHELNIPGLRHWPLRKYPHLIFYLEYAGHVEVWRVLHSHSDVPSWMQSSE